MLAHDTQNDRFEIISDDELKQVLEENPGISKAENMLDRAEESSIILAQGDGQLELVSTQLLRKILGPDNVESESDKGSAGGGFNPYDSG